MIHHVQLGAPAGSEPVARAFWVGVVGLEEIPKPPGLVARGAPRPSRTAGTLLPI